MNEGLDFYATAAQVIPVIFLALAVDLSGFVQSPIDRKMDDWREARRILEPELVSVSADRAEAEKKLEMQRELSSNEVFEIQDKAGAEHKADFDRAEQGLAAQVSLGRVVAAILSIISILALILGEAVALRVLETGNAGRTTSGIVETALWLGAWLVGWRVLDRYVERIAAEVECVARCRTALTLGSFGVVLAMTYIAWHSF